MTSPPWSAPRWIPAILTSRTYLLRLISGMIILIVSACSTHVPEKTTVPDRTKKPHDATMSVATLSPIVPFPPLASRTPLPGSPFQPWDLFASPIVTPVSTLIPTPVVTLTAPKGEINILLFGSDLGPTRMGYRTDAIVLLTLNPNGAVSMTSFPRDLYVYIPGWRMQRLNAAQPWGGFETTQETFLYNFGLHLDYFITVSMDSFRKIVDSLGGVDVNVGATLYDARDDYPNGFTVFPGVVHMDGQTALWYVRARETTGDLDRERRIEEVLLAIGRSLFSINGLARVPELYSIYQESVSTNITLEVALQLLPLLKKADPQRLHRYSIGLGQVIQWTEPHSGAYYFLPKPGAIQQLLQQAIDAK